MTKRATKNRFGSMTWPLSLDLCSLQPESSLRSTLHSSHQRSSTLDCLESLFSLGIKRTVREGRYDACLCVSALYLDIPNSIPCFHSVDFLLPVILSRFVRPYLSDRGFIASPTLISSLGKQSAASLGLVRATCLG